jgi:sugar O-acyltransferase (sialic acid O-acetyltransferase NeuD family)
MAETKRLLIVGAGGCGREVLQWACDVEASSPGWKVAGFLDSNPAALDGFDVPYPILGDAVSYLPSDSDVFVCSLGDPRRKLELVRGLLKRGARFATLVHPTVIVGARNRIGMGCILCPRVLVTTDIVLGNFVTLNFGATVAHDSVIGDGCILNPHCDINGNVRLGEGVYVGTQAVVLPGAQVGDYAKIGAGAVVLRSVAAGSTVVGVPAKAVVARSAGSE